MVVKSVEHIRQRHMRRRGRAKNGRSARTMEDDMEQKFTTMAQEAISDAVQNASAAGNAQVETLHLLDALLRQETA